MNLYLNRRRKGFSLVELAVVIVIVGVLAAFGVPRYRDSVERTKAAEAFNFLAAVRAAQERHLALKGQYADDLSTLDIDQEPPKYFNMPAVPEVTVVAGSPATTPSWELLLTRIDSTSSYGPYTVCFTQQGFTPGLCNLPAVISPVDEGGTL